MLGPRGEISRPAPSISSANRSARPIARSCTAAQPASLEHLARPPAPQASGLGAESERVESPAVLVQVGLQTGAGVEQGAIAAPAHSQALAQGRRHIEHPKAVGSAQPLLAGARISVAAQREHVGGDGADALGAVEQDRRFDVGERAWSDTSGHPAHVRARNQACVVSDRFGEELERGHPDRDPIQVPGGGQRAEQAGMLLVAREDLLARTQSEAVDHARKAPRWCRW